ncbi:MAG: hypothetical protein M3N82_01535 [Pseudomonadota bacterium]|nr:hypothetical protein [Pseudomonadota bacterium]
MNEELELELELEIVELGDAKEETKGFPIKADFEQNSSLPYRQTV